MNDSQNPASKKRQGEPSTSPRHTNLLPPHITVRETPEPKDADENFDIRSIFRRQVYGLISFFAVVVVGLIILGIIANSGRVASQDNATASEATFASQERSNCLTTLRSQQFDHQGRMVVETLRALAALSVNDSAGLGLHVAAGLEAAEEWERATQSLEPDNLDREPPFGCGPPITSEDQISPSTIQGEQGFPYQQEYNP